MPAETKFMELARRVNETLERKDSASRDKTAAENRLNQAEDVFLEADAAHTEAVKALKEYLG